MQAAINRFKARLNLPSNFTFKSRRCFEVHCISLLNRSPTLELYHAIRSLEPDKTVKAICRNGFKPSLRGNKGQGIYVANHSRYSAFWAGPRNPVIICHITIDERYIRRYKSEIRSPNWDSEFVIKDPHLIYPKYVLEYDLENIDPTFDYKTVGYVDHGEFNCLKCDSKKIRCDCQQFPTILDDDIIY